eukprot:NODE_25_length_35605_cov_0.353461.p16 type:complete len:134 gc:universal NODE_25_length_35605_cov_0.353461:28151-28552(+)
MVFIADPSLYITCSLAAVSLSATSPSESLVLFFFLLSLFFSISYKYTVPFLDFFVHAPFSLKNKEACFPVNNGASSSSISSFFTSLKSALDGVFGTESNSLLSALGILTSLPNNFSGILNSDCSADLLDGRLS